MITAFIKKYDNLRMTDAGACVSQDFSSFQNAMKREVKRLAEEIGATLVSFSKGHYDMSWFIEKDGKYVYGSYSNMDRAKVNLTGHGACYVRTASGPKDYHGGTNVHCTFEEIQEKINQLLN